MRLDSQKYEPGKLNFSLEVPGDSVGVQFRFDRSGWPEGDCLSLTFTATTQDGLTTTKGPTVFAGPAPKSPKGTGCGKSWQWGGAGFQGWCSAEMDAQGKPVFKEPGVERTKPVFATKDDSGRAVEQPINFHQPVSIEVVIEILQPLETPITAEVF